MKGYPCHDWFTHKTTGSSVAELPPAPGNCDHYPACNTLCVLVITIRGGNDLSAGHYDCSSFDQEAKRILTAITFSTSNCKETRKWRRTGAFLYSVEMKTKGCQGSEVNESEQERKKAKTSWPCTRVLQVDNYFLLPSSVTLPAAPSLETLHGTHRSKTKHERRGCESEAKRIWCVKKKKDKQTKKGGNDQVHAKHDVCVLWRDAVSVQADCAHLGMAGTRLPFSSMKWPPALSTQRWWRDMRACLAVVGVSFPSWLSAFFSGENSSSRSTSYTTKVLMDTHRTSEPTKGVQHHSKPCFESEMSIHPSSFLLLKIKDFLLLLKFSMSVSKNTNK